MCVCPRTVLGHRIICDVGQGWGLLFSVSVVEKVHNLTSLAELRSACCVDHCASGAPAEISTLLLLPNLLS
jgi:hypothetical protein